MIFRIPELLSRCVKSIKQSLWCKAAVAIITAIGVIVGICANLSQIHQAGYLGGLFPAPPKESRNGSDKNAEAGAAGETEKANQDAPGPVPEDKSPGEPPPTREEGRPEHPQVPPSQQQEPLPPKSGGAQPSGPDPETLPAEKDQASPAPGPPETQDSRPPPPLVPAASWPAAGMGAWLKKDLAPRQIKGKNGKLLSNDHMRRKGFKVTITRSEPGAIFFSSRDTEVFDGSMNRDLFLEHFSEHQVP